MSFRHFSVSGQDSLFFFPPKNFLLGREFQEEITQDGLFPARSLPSLPWLRCGHRCDLWTVKLLGSFIPPRVLLAEEEEEEERGQSAF